MKTIANLCWLFVFAIIVVVLSTISILHGVPDDPLHPTWPNIIKPTVRS